MKWLLDTYSPFILIAAFVGPFLFWMMFGIIGKFRPIPERIILGMVPSSFIVRHKQHNQRRVRQIPWWEMDRERWLRSGLGGAIFFMTILLSTLIM